MNNLSHTPYNDVNEIVNLLLTQVQNILQDQFVGMDLFGSLTYNSFDDFSDIDVLVVTHSDISDKFFSALKAMHKQIQKMDHPWATQMEVSYIPVKALRRYDHNDNKHPHLDRGYGEELITVQHDSDWTVQRHILRERGITITGPDPKTLIDFVSSNDLRNAMRPILFDWYAKNFLDMPDPFGSRGYQSYTVLSLCRILYTLQTGNVVSKTEAAHWAKDALDSRWMSLIEDALIGRLNPSSTLSSEHIKETQEMIRYSLQRAKPTLYLEVNDVLDPLLAKAKEILKDQFVGMYLYGSLSSGDFNPETSDIDFLIVTRDVLSDATISRLESMHKRICKTGLKWAAKLEGSYVPKELIRRHDPDGVPCPTVNEGKFYMDKRGSDWIIQRHVIRECGVVFEGPDPKSLIDYVSPDDIRNAVIGILDEWWFPMLDDPSWLRDKEAGDRAFSVITMCRVLHALEHGTIVSKPRAVRWARIKLDDSWRRLIDQAVAVSRHEEQDIQLDRALHFIRFVKEKYNDNTR